MLSHFHNCRTLTFPVYSGKQMFLAYLYPLGYRYLPLRQAGNQTFGLLKYPRITYSTSAYKYSINTITVFLFKGNLGRSYIAIAKIGMVIRGFSFTLPINVQSASPLYICVLVRPCMLKACTPTS